MGVRLSIGVQIMQRIELSDSIVVSGAGTTNLTTKIPESTLKVVITISSDEVNAANVTVTPFVGGVASASALIDSADTTTLATAERTCAGEDEYRFVLPAHGSNETTFTIKRNYLVSKP